MKTVFMKKKILLAGMALGMLSVQAQQRPASIDQVFAPIRVATLPTDAYIGLSQLDNGELRYYNYGEQQADRGSYYLSSKDKGMTWQRVAYPKEMPYADRKSPISGEYIRLVNMGKQGTYCIRTVGGLEGDRTITKVSDVSAIMLKPPVFVRGGKRILVCGHGDVSPKGCYTFVSDDDGKTWKRSNTVTAPDHKKEGFHQGIRWNHGAVEPTVVELNDGRIWMLMRTSQDYHYEAFSEDGGLTWGESRPSAFYGTITMPTIGRLADGRLLFFWCNTTPLPELPRANGVWDDVFTNRDVTHVAISEDDGKTWKGFRELYIDPCRNDKDYALTGWMDRSVHQAQFEEVAPGKIVVAVGQHYLHRSMLVFDVDWLYEKERFCNFEDSLNSWTTFNYIDGVKGHCAYNRINGCTLKSHPEKEGKSVLHLQYEPDKSLVADTRGAVWNFPSAKKGTFKTSVRIPEGSENLSLILNDRWMNPCDTVACYESMYLLPLNRKKLGIKDDAWHQIEINWDLTKKNSPASVRVDGKNRKLRLDLKRPTRNGISYVHFMAAPAASNSGMDIEWVKAEKKD